MKKFLLLLSALTSGYSLSAQYVYTLEHAGTTKVFTRLDSALYYASDGDFLYLPGASIAGSMVIGKKLNIFGAGHYPDSTQATGQTSFTGNVHFLTESSGSILQGVYISGNVYFGTTSGNATAQNILISRCNVQNILLSENGSDFRGVENVFIRENVIRDGIYLAYARNVVIENNIMEGGFVYGNGTIAIRNNILLRRTPWLINNLSGATFENNIILSSASFANSANNFYYNNIFRETDPLGAEFSSGNVFNVTDLFVNQSGLSFVYNQNYHLTATSPARGAGTQGTDCGIYGGASPYKEGAVPANPHIQFKSIPSQTDAQGKINIQVRVAAQQN